MRERTFEEERPYNLTVYVIATLLVGGLAGYILASSTGASTSPRQVVAATASPATGVLFDDGALRAYQNILGRDPKNVEAAVGAGNLLYDAKRYIEAIPYYQQALAIKDDINVSTDLGTALWYAGRADEALAQYAKSLAIDPNHAQTLFNVGIVKSDGKRDFRGAVDAWQALLDKNPSYPNATNVKNMIAGAQRQITSTY
jgi:Flp pilus assembly protein TadD